jgi:hypothetical protein
MNVDQHALTLVLVSIDNFTFDLDEVGPSLTPS